MSLRRCGWLLVVLVVALGTALPAWAEEDDKNAGQEFLDRAVALKLSAENFSELGNVISLCEKAIEKGLDDSNTEFASTLLASVAHERAEKMLGVMLSTPRDDPRFAKMHEVATTDIKLALKHEPEQPRSHLLAARLAAMPSGDKDKGPDKDKALAEVNKALELIGDHEESKQDLGARFEALMVRSSLQEEVKPRLADLDEAIKLKPKEATPLRMRGAVKMAAEPPDAEGALADLDAAILLEPEHATTYELRGRVLASLGKLDEAVASFDRALELDPESAEALLRRAEVYLVLRKNGKAMDDATQALMLVPGHPVLLMLRSQAAMELGNPEMALADINRILERDAESIKAYRVRSLLIRAQVHARMNHLDEAVADVQKVIDLEPTNLEGYFDLSLLQRKQKKFDQALATLDGVLKDHPESWFLLSSRADTLLSIGRHKEAIADLEKALALQPKESGILNNLAWLLATSPDDELRNGKRAVELATTACEVTDFEAPHILSTLAAAHAETGDFESARKWSKKAVDLATKEQRTNLKKELDTYLAKKPIRERLNEAGDAPAKPPVNNVDVPEDEVKRSPLDESRK